MDPDPQRFWENVLDIVDLAIPILGLTKRSLDGRLKETFLFTMITLAGRRGRLPSSFAMMDKVEVSDKILPSGGFADVRTGVHEGLPVAVRALRVSPGSDMNKIRNVRSPPAIERDTK